MPNLSRFCKAYPISELRRFAGWKEKPAGEAALASDGFLYVHDSLVVTDGIYSDENVVFADVTPEWELFCREQLHFQVPPELIDSASAKTSSP